MYLINTPQGPREIKPGEHYMSVTRGIRGWFAVELWLNNQEPDIGPFVEPWQSMPSSWATREEAQRDAEATAEALELPLEV